MHISVPGRPHFSRFDPKSLTLAASTPRDRTVKPCKAVVPGTYLVYKPADPLAKPHTDHTHTHGTESATHRV